MYVRYYTPIIPPPPPLTLNGVNPVYISTMWFHHPLTTLSLSPPPPALSRYPFVHPPQYPHPPYHHPACTRCLQAGSKNRPQEHNKGDHRVLLQSFCALLWCSSVVGGGGLFQTHTTAYLRT